MIIKHNTPIVFDTENSKPGHKAALVIKSASIASFIDLRATADLGYGGGGRLYVREVPEVRRFVDGLRANRTLLPVVPTGVGIVALSGSIPLQPAP